MIDADYLLISGIQHFIFCRRQWALIHIDCQWADNRFTAEGNITHQRVHDPNSSFMRNGILSIRGLQVKSEELRIEGVCDAVEFIMSADGVKIKGHEGNWNPMPVEYKHGSSKATDCDRIQLAAQAVCLEEMLCCRIESGAIYYEKTHSRENVKISDELRIELKKTVREMRNLYESKRIPKVREKKSCKNCSLYSICLPQLIKNGNSCSVDLYIKNHILAENI